MDVLPTGCYATKYRISEWRELVKESSDFDKPFMQPLYVGFYQGEIISCHNPYI